MSIKLDVRNGTLKNKGISSSKTYKPSVIITNNCSNLLLLNVLQVIVRVILLLIVI